MPNLKVFSPEDLAHNLNKRNLDNTLALLAAKKGGEVMATQKHYTHITFEMRVFIENYVTERRSLAFIARKLDIDPTSISRELKRNRRYDGYNHSLTSRNTCIHRSTCTLRKLCDTQCKKKCSSCSLMCHEGKCSSYEKQWCRHTHRAPFVCNGCTNRYKCPLERYTYSAKVAQSKADSRLVESRVGLNMTGHDMADLAQVVRQGLALGQSVHHIFASHPNLACSERSFYRHVENEVIDIHKMDLHKKVKYKPRKTKKNNRHESLFYKGREYSDYLKLNEAKRLSVVQMDCVEGIRSDEQAILTLHFVTLRFQIYVLLSKKSSDCVVAALDYLEQLCGGKEVFKKIFGVILTDRGCEFDDYLGIEKGARCKVYYTDPQRPNQKGGCEKNHVELRKIIPKGTSLDSLGLNAWIMAEICSHANSSTRLSIGNASPMALAQIALPASLLDGLGLVLIPPDKVETRPELISRLKQERDKTKQ